MPALLLQSHGPFGDISANDEPDCATLARSKRSRNKLECVCDKFGVSLLSLLPPLPQPLPPCLLTQTLLGPSPLLHSPPQARPRPSALQAQRSLSAHPCTLCTFRPRLFIAPLTTPRIFHGLRPRAPAAPRVGLGCRARRQKGGGQGRPRRPQCDALSGRQEAPQRHRPRAHGCSRRTYQIPRRRSVPNSISSRSPSHLVSPSAGTFHKVSRASPIHPPTPPVH